MSDTTKESAMENEERLQQIAALRQMTDFGMFYPRGYLVAAFRRQEDAEQVRRDLLAGGYDEEDCVLVRP
jgi:hypothetical protein